MDVRRKERKRIRFSRKRRKGNPGMREREPHRWVRVDSRPIRGDPMRDARRGYLQEIYGSPLRGRGRNGRNRWNIRPSARRGNEGRSPYKSQEKETNSSAGYVRFPAVGRSVSCLPYGTFLPPCLLGFVSTTRDRGCPGGRESKEGGHLRPWQRTNGCPTPVHSGGPM